MDGRARRVLHLQPCLGAARAVGQIAPFRDDAFEAQLAGVSEQGGAVQVAGVLVEADTNRRASQQFTVDGQMVEKMIFQ